MKALINGAANQVNAIEKIQTKYTNNGYIFGLVNVSIICIFLVFNDSCVFCNGAYLG